LARGALGIGVEEQRPLERGEGELVRTERTLERVAPQARDELGAAADDPGLRPAEQLVARERDETGTCSEALADERLVADSTEAPRAEVVDEYEPESLRDFGQASQFRSFREPDLAEVGLMDPEQ